MENIHSRHANTTTRTNHHENIQIRKTSLCLQTTTMQRSNYLLRYDLSPHENTLFRKQRQEEMEGFLLNKEDIYQLTDLILLLGVQQWLKADASTSIEDRLRILFLSVENCRKSKKDDAFHFYTGWNMLRQGPPFCPFKSNDANQNNAMQIKNKNISRLEGGAVMDDANAANSWPA